MNINLDHLVVAANDIESGVQYISDVLGVDIPKGGEHTSMGTHNHLMKLGEEVFLEVIAPSPDLDPPAQPRWYGLDDPAIRYRLNQSPALVGWVINTSDIQASLNAAQTGAMSFGQVVNVTRGNLEWMFALPSDGRLLASGMLPYIIQWQTDEHPARKMGDTGCQLLSLELRHAQTPWLGGILDSISASHLVQKVQLAPNASPELVATISTPSGIRELSSAIRQID